MTNYSDIMSMITDADQRSPLTVRELQFRAITLCPTCENGSSTSTKVGGLHSNWGTCKSKDEFCVHETSGAAVFSIALLPIQCRGHCRAVSKSSSKCALELQWSVHLYIVHQDSQNIDIRYIQHLFVTDQFVLHNVGNTQATYSQLTVCQFSTLSAHNFSLSAAPPGQRETAHCAPLSTHTHLHSSFKYIAPINQLNV